jgi:hypothetical protein
LTLNKNKATYETAMPIIPAIPPEGVVLNLTAEEAKREAIGKALGLVGTLIGVTGTLIAMSVNPAVKDQASAAYARVPQSIKQNQTLILVGLGLVGAFVAYKWIGSGVKKQALGRYK